MAYFLQIFYKPFYSAGSASVICGCKQKNRNVLCQQICNAGIQNFKFLKGELKTSSHLILKSLLSPVLIHSLMGMIDNIKAATILMLCAKQAS